MHLWGPTYPLRPQLQGPFKNQNLTPQQADFNKSMSTVRTSIEWVFREILNYFFFFVDYKKKLKFELSAVGKMYCVFVFFNKCTHLFLPII